MADFYLKQNDTRPFLTATLQDSAGAAINLTGASVRFHMLASDGSVIVDAAAVVQDAATGVVRYEWQPADTAVTGTFKAEIEVTYADGGIETFPNTTNWQVKVANDLA